MGFEVLGLWAAVDVSTLPQQFANGLVTGSIYALVALGYTMVYGVLRLINFAHGEVFMLGMFAALFASWWLGFGPNMIAGAQGNPLILIAMLTFAMLVSGLIGVGIERFAYRPMRNQSRIASLITAIGVSLLIQHGGALFLPVSPPPSIREDVNPYRSNVTWQILPKDGGLLEKVKLAQINADRATTALNDQMKAEGVNSEFDLSPASQPLRQEKSTQDRALRDAQQAADQSGVNVTLSQGKVILMLTTLFLMIALRFLVMNTPIGRQMRAVAHDFDSASLMGVNVNKVVLFTFFVGSALAGAGGMMAATFQGDAMTTFSGLQYGVKGFIAAVLGGIGNIPGAVVGGILLGVSEVGVTAFGMSEYKDIIAFVILILVLLFRPGGILGSAKVEKV